MIDEIVAKVQEEEAKEIQNKIESQENRRRSLDKYLKEREEWKKREKERIEVFFFFLLLSASSAMFFPRQHTRRKTEKFWSTPSNRESERNKSRLKRRPRWRKRTRSSKRF
jgi:hypothetical protein